MFLSLCSTAAGRFAESIRFVLIFCSFSSKKIRNWSGKKRKKGSYNTSCFFCEIKLQKEENLVTIVSFLQHNSTKKTQFRDVLQEMHRKKLRERGKAGSSNSPQTEASL